MRPTTRHAGGQLSRRPIQWLAEEAVASFGSVSSILHATAPSRIGPVGPSAGLGHVNQAVGRLTC
jgi:hypothetical protein